MKYFLMFAECHKFSSVMVPFAKQSHGPELFTRDFLSSNPGQEAESKEIQEAFLTLKLIKIRLGVSKDEMKILSYQLNLVYRQFRLRQIQSKCFFDRKNDLCLWLATFSKVECDDRLKRHVFDPFSLTPFSFQPSFYSAKEFNTWWKAYHIKEFDPVAILS